MSDQNYPRDLVGYGANPPQVAWPGGARIAVQFVINYEEGAENCVLHGDDASEAFLSEIVGAAAYPGQRHMNMESLYDYGARAGFWRLHRLFSARKMPLTVFGVAMALLILQVAYYWIGYPFLIRKLLGPCLRGYLNSTIPSFVSSLFMAACLLLILIWIEVGGVTSLTFIIVLGGVIYVGVYWLLFRRQFQETVSLWQMVKK